MEFNEVINNGDSLTYKTRMDLTKSMAAMQAAEKSALFLFSLYFISAIYQLKRLETIYLLLNVAY